jgi:hypothetical protein
MLRGVQREYRAQDGRLYVMDPHTLSWFCGHDPTSLAPLAVYKGGVNSRASSGAIRSPESGSVQFDALQGSLDRGPEPSTAEALLVTSEERLTQMLLREAVVSLATAVEVASDAFIHRHNADQQVDSIIRSRDSFAAKRLHRVPQRVVGRSLESDNKSCYEQVERLYRVRNQVAHAGQLQLGYGPGAASIGAAEVRGFVSAARTAVRWLDQ